MLFEASKTKRIRVFSWPIEDSQAKENRRSVATFFMFANQAKAMPCINSLPMSLEVEKEHLPIDGRSVLLHANGACLP